MSHVKYVVYKLVTFTPISTIILNGKETLYTMGDIRFENCNEWDNDINICIRCPNDSYIVLGHVTLNKDDAVFKGYGLFKYYNNTETLICTYESKDFKECLDNLVRHVVEVIMPKTHPEAFSQDIVKCSIRHI